MLVVHSTEFKVQGLKFKVQGSSRMPGGLAVPTLSI